MRDYQLSNYNLDDFFLELQKELTEEPLLIVTTQSAKTGKWGMARLWRSWMATTANYMADRGSVMPLMIKPDGGHYGSRKFNSDDAHELFTCQWMGVDGDGKRLSWAKKDTEDRRCATKGERFNAMMQHENWCVEKGIKLLQPRESEYRKLQEEQNQ